MAECKRCLLLESSGADTLSDIRQRISKLSEKEKAPQDLYLKRLEMCKECDELISGVCMKCGCYVEFRAAFIKQKCPNANNRKW